jgi:peroxiredoxin
MIKNYVLIFLIALAFHASAQNAKQLPKFSIEKLEFYKSTPNLKIVAIVPSLSYDCKYADMMTTAFHYYFIKGLIFTDSIKPKIDIILIVKYKDEMQNKSRNFGPFFSVNVLDGMVIHYDADGSLQKSLGVENIRSNQTKSEQASNWLLQNDSIYNASSTLYLLDNDNHILLTDTNYRGQGEHLKVLENKIKKYLNIPVPDFTSNTYKKLRVGDLAPDFEVVNNNNPHIKNNLRDDTTKVKVLTFYPAAFSGSSIIYNSKDISCVFQLTTFEKAFDRNQAKIYAITSSNPEILMNWKTSLRSYIINYVNDSNYEISKKYHALNEKGYNNRVSYIIDKNNIIRYIDEDFTSEDELILADKVNALDTTKK